MRSCLSKDRNPGALLTPENRSILVRSNFLLHSAHNCPLSVSGCHKGCQEMVELWLNWFFCLLQSLLRLITGSAWDGAPSLQSQTQIPSVAGFGRDFNFKCSWCRYYFVLTFFFDVGNLRLDHLVIDQSQYCNPMASSTYDDEDFVGKNKEVGTNVPTYVSRLPVPRKIRSLCVLPVAATVDGLMINWYMFQT